MEKNEAIGLEHDTTIHTFGGFMLLHIFHPLFVQINNVQISIMCFYKAVQQQQPGHGVFALWKRHIGLETVWTRQLVRGNLT